jgi:hypothetical protein
VNVIELACKFRKEIDGKIVASAKVHVNRVRLQGGVKSLTS